MLLIPSAGADQHTISEHGDFGFLFKQGHCKGPSTVSPASQFRSRELWTVLAPLSCREESPGRQDGSRVVLAVGWSCRSLPNLFDSVSGYFLRDRLNDLESVPPERHLPCCRRLSWGVLVLPSFLVHRLLHRLAPALVGSHSIYGSGHGF